MKTVVLHRTFDKTVETSGDPIYFMADADGVTKLTGAKFDKWTKTLDGNTTVRMTNSTMFVPIHQLADTTGATFVSCHWHKTGISKGLEPEAIAAAFLTLPDDIFRPIVLREELLDLKTLVQMRYAAIDFRRAWQLKRSAELRGRGFGDNVPAHLKEALGEDEIKLAKKEVELPIDKAIAKQASVIPECVLLNKILGVKGAWTTAATVVAYLGDMDRFSTVSGLWKYSGYDVVAGKAPKRAKGQVQTWNGKLRTSLWLWADSMLKTKNEIWRPVYDQYREQELAVHASKCPCKAIEGHSGARARRRVVKDVLKAFFAATHPANKSMETNGMLLVVAAKEIPAVATCALPVVKKKRAVAKKRVAAA